VGGRWVGRFVGIGLIVISSRMNDVVTIGINFFNIKSTRCRR
jgi:hypothetical protein